MAPRSCAAPGKPADGPSGQRVQDTTAEGAYEIACPGCGDHPDRDWPKISGELRGIRGASVTKAGGPPHGSHRHADALTAAGPP